MADELKPAYLIGGSDRPKIRTALARLRSRYGEGEVEALSALEGAAGDDVVAVCNTLGLFGGERRLVVVEGVDGRRNAEGRLSGGWKVADVKAVAAYLESPSPGTVLALVAEEAKRDGPLAKAVLGAKGDLLVYDVPRKLAGWVSEQFVRRGAKVDLDACRLLIEIVGETPDALATEIDKLVTWAGGETIDERAVQLLASPLAETTSFELTDAWGARNVGAALAAAESILERSSGPRRDELPRLSAMLASHVGRVRACQSLAAEGLSSRDAATRLKRSPYYVQKLYVQAGNYSVEELRGATVRLAQLDRALKGGSRLAGDLELERTLVLLGS